MAWASAGVGEQGAVEMRERGCWDCAGDSVAANVGAGHGLAGGIANSSFDCCAA